MSEHLQIRSNQLQTGIPAMRSSLHLICLTVLCILLSLQSDPVLGQVSAQQEKLFIHDGHSMKSLHAGEKSYSGKELLTFHPTLLLRALELADPSFINQGTEKGSDPNAYPQAIDMQGTRSLPLKFSQADALPLIIVDGHRESAERLKDFDMQRIERVVLLKNAATTACYGIQAAQGVILIQTKIPETHKLHLSYRFDGTFQRATTRHFDLMNGIQKLEWEKGSGVYKDKENLFEQRMTDVQKYGSTDWLRMPLQTAFSHRHRIGIDGGDSTLRYRGELHLASTKGVMKGSARKIYGASAFIGYASSSLRISNEICIDRIDSKESTAGPLFQWVQINPYYLPTDERRHPYDILGKDTFSEQESPLYEISLGSLAENKTTRINNNFTIRWNIDRHFSLSGQFNLTGDYDKRSEFVSPSSLVYRNYPIEESGHIGSYRILRNNLTSYQEKIWTAYDVQRNRHLLHAVLGMEISSTTYTEGTLHGTGFSSDHMNYISFAQYYAQERPRGHEQTERLLSGYASVDWDYSGIISVGFSGRIDKSSMLAPQKRTAGSYSASIQYDIRENLFKSSCWIHQLAMTAGYGCNAGYQFDYEMTHPVYLYDIDNPYLNGMGDNSSQGDFSKGLVTLTHSNPYNPALKWKQVKGFHLGLKSHMGPIFLMATYYNSRAEELVGIEKQAAFWGSTVRYANNGAIRNSGIEFSIRGLILKSRDMHIQFYLNGVANNSKIIRLSNHSAQRFNTEALNKGLFIGMVKGEAADGIYTLSSAGINPENGKEEFYRRDGSITNSPSADDRIFQGTLSPKLRGRFGVAANYRKVDLALIFGYSLHATHYNTYEQQAIDWAATGVNLPQKAINKWTPFHKTAIYQGAENPVRYASSRFVAKENTLSLASLSIGYAFPRKITTAMRMHELQIRFTCDDLWHTSSVKSPRSLYYPYASSFIFSLHATF